MEPIATPVFAVIPVIDLGFDSPVKKVINDDDWATLAKSFGQALHEIGFVYLENHGIPQQLIKQTFRETSTFFQLPQEVKNKYRKNIKLNYHGYSEPGQERLHSDAVYEFKETFDIWGEKRYFPDLEVPNFQQVTHELEIECKMLARKLMKLLGLALELEDPEYFLKTSLGLDIYNNNTLARTPSLLRTIYYPPISNREGLPDGAVRCGEHTDYDLLTMLFTDSSGGLEVKSKVGVWQMVQPEPGKILLNIGETLEIASDGYFPATPHRVRFPPDHEKQQMARHSLGYFIYQDTGTVVKPLKTLGGEQLGDFKPFDPILRGLEKAQQTYTH